MPDVPTPAKGDIDGDGSITAADVSALAWALVDGSAGAIDLETADIDGDGSITAGDVSGLIQLIK